MAYKEKYPLDITPQGDTVPESIQKNRSEILNIAQNMELKDNNGSSGSGGGLRNRVLSGKVSNGEFAFLTGDSLSVMIDGSQTPVLLSFADGFNDYGAVDYIATIDRKGSAWSLPANSTSYLYVERSASGGLSYGSTTLEPLRQPNVPEASVDKMYYNTMSEKMYVYTGTSWKSMLRVIVGVVKTDSTSVKSIKYYRPTFGTDFITDKSITTNKLGDGAVQSNNIGNAQVEKEHLAESVKTLIEGVRSEINEVLKKVYPIGSIYCSTVGTNPNSLFGFGTWEYIEQGRVLLSQGSKYAAGTTGGSEMHTLTIEEMPSHNHHDNTENAGNHNHNRGDMNITGDFWAAVGSTNGSIGAFSIVETGLGYTQWGSNAKDSRRFLFNAANSWTGNTNTTGDHTHKIPNDGGGQSHSIMQPYLSVYIWKRVS